MVVSIGNHAILRRIHVRITPQEQGWLADVAIQLARAQGAMAPKILVPTRAAWSGVQYRQGGARDDRLKPQEGVRAFQPATRTPD